MDESDCIIVNFPDVCVDLNALFDAFCFPIAEKKNRASWTTAQLDLLVSMMKEYADAAKFRGQNGWTKEGWKSMATRLNNQFPRANFIVDQLKFREQRLKKEYFIVKSIVEKSGFGFDPNTKMPTTIDEKWDELSKEQQKWRYKAFPYYDDLHAIYDGALVSHVINLAYVLACL